MSQSQDTSLRAKLVYTVVFAIFRGGQKLHYGQGIAWALIGHIGPFLIDALSSPVSQARHLRYSYGPANHWAAAAEITATLCLLNTPKK